jgi:hypothetical protein
VFLPGPDSRLQMVQYEVEGVARAAPMSFMTLDSEEKIRAHEADIAEYDRRPVKGAKSDLAAENPE